MKSPLLVSAAVCLSQQTVLLTQRPESKELAGLWEFPGGKVELGETPYDALCRELREELAVEVTSATPYFFIHHQYPTREVLLLFYLVGLMGKPQAMEGNTIQWVPLEALETVDIVPADAPLIRKILDDNPTALINNSA